VNGNAGMCEDVRMGDWVIWGRYSRKMYTVSGVQPISVDVASYRDVIEIQVERKQLSIVPIEL
jgi:hypothetical protein